jgi:hypothetical protein
MKIDISQIRTILKAVLADAALSLAEASGVIAVAWLAVDADRREDDDEVTSVDAIATEVRAVAGVAKDAPADPVADVPTDNEELATRLADLAPRLGVAAREVAYSVAYALSVVDYNLAVGESELLTMIRSSFQLDDDRVLDLSVAVGEALTPAE